MPKPVDIVVEGLLDPLKAAVKQIGGAFTKGYKGGYEGGLQRHIGALSKKQNLSPEETKRLAQLKQDLAKSQQPADQATGATPPAEASTNGHTQSKEAQAAQATGQPISVQEYFKGTPKKGSLEISSIVQQGLEKSFYGTYDGRDLMFRVTPDRISLYAKGATIPAASNKTGKALGDGLKELDIAYRLATAHVEKLAAADEEYSAGRAVDRLRRLTDLVARMQKGEKRKVNFTVGGKVLPIEIAVLESAVDLALQYGYGMVDEAVASLSKLETPE